MGFHANVFNGIVSLLRGALPQSVPVLDGLSVDEAQLERYASSVVMLRESIDYEPHPEINPNTSTLDQGAEWSWALYVTTGGGGARSADRGQYVDDLLETIQTALNARRPTTDCGPLHLVSEDFEGKNGSSVMYVQRWRHRRLA